MDAEFRLLGDVELRAGDRVVDLGHARQRCVLAVLLIEANRLVPADQLLDRVWADRPPRRARNALSGYLSRLRPLLAPLDIAIEHSAGGYVLTIDPSIVDVHLFHELAGEGRAAADEALLERALGLWRGEAFGCLDTPWLNDVRARLDAERHAVELDFYDLALARGRHGELLGELSARAHETPQDERLAGQLMLALYRGGRQSDALRHFEVVRRGLAEELATDPTPALQALHHNILTGNPDLSHVDTSPPPAKPTRGPAPRQLDPAPRQLPPAPRQLPPAPHQLPPAPRHFTGRKRELAGLDGAGPIIVLSGSAGAGKTALALHWAHTAKDRFPGGQLYVNLRGFGPDAKAMTPAEAIQGFLDALGVTRQRQPAGLDARAGLYRSLVAGRRMLILLDNARDADQVRPLLPGTDSCLVVVTSRDRLAGLIATAGAHPLTVDPLPNPTTPRPVRSVSTQAVSPQAERMLRYLTAHPGPDLTPAAAASLAGVRVPRARTLLAELCQARLVTQSTPGRYYLHDGLRAYAEEQAMLNDTTDERLTIAHRGLEHYLHTAHACAKLLDPSRFPIAIGTPRKGVTPESPSDHNEALAWFTAEHHVLLCCVKSAAGAGLDGYTWRLAWTMWTYLDSHGYWLDLMAVGRAGLADSAKLGHARGQAFSHRLLGLAALRLGRSRRARSHLRCALELYRRAGDIVGETETHHEMAVLREDGRVQDLAHSSLSSE